MMLYYRSLTHKMTMISQGNPVEADQSSGSAMLVIDIQEGTTGTSSGINEYREAAGTVIQTINRLADHAGTEEIQVIYVFHETTNRFFNLINNSFARGSSGAQPDARLNN